MEAGRRERWVSRKRSECVRGNWVRGTLGGRKRFVGECELSKRRMTGDGKCKSKRDLLEKKGGWKKGCKRVRRN